MIIVCGGIKGGTGKTTLLANFAVLALKEGKRVLIVDCDNQHSLLSWSDARHGRNDKRNCPVTVCMRGPNVGSELAKIATDYDVVLVDTDGQDGGSQRSALIVADIVVSTFGPRAQDVWTADQVADLIRGAQNVNAKLKSIAILNRADCRGRQNDEAAECLTNVLSLAPERVGERKALAMAWQEGLAVCELPASRRDVKAEQEIAALWTRVKGL